VVFTRITSHFLLKAISNVSGFILLIPRRAILALLGALGWGQSRIWHLAAFLAGLPSKGQEIDDKLPSNSR
jgi:hypothetical protein